MPALVFVFLGGSSPQAKESERPQIEPLMRVVDLTMGDTRRVELENGTHVSVRLVAVEEPRDALRGCIREARVTVEIDGRKVRLPVARYQLPITVGPVQIDCPVTKGLLEGPVYNKRVWALEADARLRLWPAGSPWIRPGTFTYPIRQRWFASDTQMANEIAFVNGEERLDYKTIYYHYGLDVGGVEGEVEVVAASGGVVVGAGEDVPRTEHPMPLVEARYARVHIRDDRGWYHRYCHLHAIDPAIKVGLRVKRGQKIGILGKQGTSGGWAHTHFDIMAPLPNGRYGIVEPYAFYWQAYHQEHDTQLQAVARPHRLAAVGQKVTLDAARSWSRRGPDHLVAYRWKLSDGTEATGASVERRYDRPGTYSEILRIEDDQGRIDYDFCVVQVLDPARPDQAPPTIHAAYAPTFAIAPGDEVTFAARTFRIGRREGRERWDFGDGSPPVEVQSDGNADMLAEDGYALTTHRYRRSGHYLASVTRTNARGESATAHLHVRVETPKAPE